MRSLHNIEKSAFRRGEYVGYAHGVWRIRRAGNGWLARHQDGTAPRPSESARTLEELSEKLDAVAGRAL